MCFSQLVYTFIVKTLSCGATKPTKWRCELHFTKHDAFNKTWNNWIKINSKVLQYVFCENKAGLATQIAHLLCDPLLMLSVIRRSDWIIFEFVCSLNNWAMSPILLVESRHVFCLLLGVSSDYAQLITGQVTESTRSVIGRPQPKLTRARYIKRAQALFVI